MKETATRVSTGHLALVVGLFFVSGAAALIYEVLWMRELGRLYGNSVHATATTLSAFFLGLMCGGYVWGQRAPRLTQPLRTYGLLEAAAGVSAAGYFVVVPLYHHVYPVLFQWCGGEGAVLTAVTLILALGVLFPPTFFLGGTLPVVSQHLVRTMERTGRTVSLVYAANTVGGAIGALLAGFYLPMLVGVRASYMLAMSATVVTGLAAVWIARGREVPLTAAVTAPRPIEQPGARVSGGTLRLYAVLSGFVTIALQVFWTRMCAQVLQNSVYTFAAILVVFLLCLGVGAVMAHLMMRTRALPQTCLFWMLVGAGLSVSASPSVFSSWTSGLRYVGAGGGWEGYVLGVLLMMAVTIGPPLVLLGALFPLLLRLGESHDDSPGRMVGTLAALNTGGAIVGALAAGFVVLELVGLWAGIRLMGVLYLLAALHLAYAAYTRTGVGRRRLAVSLCAIVLATAVLDVMRVPQVRIDPTGEEQLLEVWDGSAATVAVVRRKDALRLKVDNHYVLGGTGARELEALQGYLPVLLHPRARSVFVLGLGTGITAGASLEFGIERLEVVELVPDVVRAAQKYFSPYSYGLFADPRARVIVNDGRSHLAATPHRFDVVIGDLFVPWKAGVGNLYTVEHFTTVRERLAPGGHFMQWLPAYQLSRDEFSIIVRTMLEVFPQVTAWRGDFRARRPIVGLLGHPEIVSLAPAAPACAIQASAGSAAGQRAGEDRVPLLAHYIGDLDAIRPLLSSYPLNRDDWPIIEYQAPITQRLERAGAVSWLGGEEFLHFMTAVHEHAPPARDRYLARLSPALRALPAAGLDLHRARVLKDRGDVLAADQSFERYQRVVRGLTSD